MILPAQVALIRLGITSSMVAIIIDRGFLPEAADLTDGLRRNARRCRLKR